MRLPEDPDTPPQVNIVPMIDAIFAILAFFIISSLSLTRTEGIPANLPKADTSQLQERVPIAVSVNTAGEVWLGDRPIDLTQLETALQQAIAVMQSETPALVVVRADAIVPHGRVVQVMDVLRQVEGIDIAIATQTPTPSE